jgi:hypothetical protein
MQRRLRGLSWEVYTQRFRQTSCAHFAPKNEPSKKNKRRTHFRRPFWVELVGTWAAVGSLAGDSLVGDSNLQFAEYIFEVVTTWPTLLLRRSLHVSTLLGVALLLLRVTLLLLTVLRLLSVALLAVAALAATTRLGLERLGRLGQLGEEASAAALLLLTSGRCRQTSYSFGAKPCNERGMPGGGA